MITIKGLQVFNQSKFEKIKCDIVKYFSFESREINGLITKAYLEEKRGSIKSCFEKDTIEYFKDVLIETFNNSTIKNKNLLWHRKRNEELFFKHMSEVIMAYGNFEKAYIQSKKDFKFTKTGIQNPIFHIIFDNEKKIIIIKENNNLFVNPYYSNRLKEATHKSNRDSFFYYKFFEYENNNLYHIERKNKTLKIENIIEKKLNVPCKKIK